MTKPQSSLKAVNSKTVAYKAYDVKHEKEHSRPYTQLPLSFPLARQPKSTIPVARGQLARVRDQLILHAMSLSGSHVSRRELGLGSKDRKDSKGCIDPTRSTAFHNGCG